MGFIYSRFTIHDLRRLWIDLADPKDKFDDNVPGLYFVDTSCIDCDVCRDTAPANFTRNDEGQYSYVCKQPATPEELAACAEALTSCPVEAIGDNGQKETMKAER